MCGIAGVVTRSADERNAGTVAKMVHALRHRGPDSQGVTPLERCALGNTRLAIVDLSERGQQPMSNESETCWITYNGECYNAAELREMLAARGWRFRSTTDTEVVLCLYEEFGEGFVEKLRGMFAFAIWDTRSQSLLLARDRLGIKPLYFACVSEALLFASEIKALLASDLVPGMLDPAAARVFLQLGHIPPPWTAVRGIEPLLPGEIGIWREGNFFRKPYWIRPEIPRNGGSSLDGTKAANELGEILTEASRLQLMSDVPIALFLSGGTDSAVLGSLMRHAGAERLTALTIGFAETSFDESESSRRTAEMLGLAHRILPLRADQMAESLDLAIWAMDQPTVNGLNAFWICRAAHEAGFKVAISGQGGDELFGGYESAEMFAKFTHVATSLRPLPTKLLQEVLDREALPFRWRKISYLAGADDPFVAAQMAVKVLFLEKDVEALLSAPLRGEGLAGEAERHLSYWSSQSAGCSLPERIAFMDFHTHLEPRLLRDADAMSMAHSLELRPVFLDHAVVENALSLPAAVRWNKKRLLLEATRKFMPENLARDVAARPKRTFTFPFARWLGNELRATIEKVFDRERLLNSGVLEPESVAAFWKHYLRSPAAVGWSRIWSLYVLQRWCEIMGVRA
ncbi:MAG: asparagine synthase (glutamine-hydrolyzing) [Candidatus Acidiferrales bacterium]